jgi:oligopeptide/dipeptide ABC transporter ATP-binding protein
MSDHVAVMYLGQIVEHATAEAIYATPKHPYTRALLSAIPVPDPTNRDQRRASRIVLEGDVPSPIEPPTGCRFHPRCAYARADCSTRVPLLESTSMSVHARETTAQNGAVACHYWREI